MMLERNTGELLTTAAFMHRDDQGHDALKHYVILKGLKPFIDMMHEHDKALVTHQCCIHAS